MDDALTREAEVGPQRDSTSPAVSVIVPVYNAATYLDQALESIESQTLRDLEIICVNDGSTDDSPAILAAHAARDGRVRVIDKENGGYGSACNVGLDAARGAWIAIVEPDDWIEEGMYADMVSFAESFGADVDIVKTPYWRVLNPDTPRQMKVNCSYRRRIRPATQPFALADPGATHLIIHHPSIWSAIYARDFIVSRGIRFHEIPGAGWADNPFLYDTLCQSDRIIYLDKPYYCYREETPEKTVAFSRGNMFVPFDRWHDMADVLDRLGVDDENIRRAHTRRGFLYLDHVGAGVNLDAPVIQERIKAMFDRMDDELVFSESRISPAWKREYARIEGVPVRGASRLPYSAALASAGLYSLTNIGPVATAATVTDFLTRGNEAQDPSNPALTAPLRDLGEFADVKVSVVLPVYNAERYLDGCLDSLAAQTHANFEVLCVDDGSTDGSRALLERRAAADARIRIVSKENGGPSSARNAGIRAATGDYVCFLDADDFFEPRACASIARVGKRMEADAVVFGWTYFAEGPDSSGDLDVAGDRGVDDSGPAADGASGAFDSIGDILRSRGSDSGADGLDAQARRFIDEQSNVRSVFYPAFAPPLLFEEATNPYLRIAVRREALVASGVAFDESLRIGEDAQFLFALLPRIGSVQLLADKLYRYRLPRPGSIMQEVADDLVEECFADMNMAISIFGDWKRGGLLARYGGDLVQWFTVFLLYTLLRFEQPARDAFTAITCELLHASFGDDVLGAIEVPDHTARLLRVVLDADAQGRLAIDDRALSLELLRWRIAEYGPADLARTVIERLR